MNTRHTKNTWIVALAALSTVGNVQAQTADNFESYSDGQALNDVNNWEWNGTVNATSYSYDTNKGYPIPGAHTKVMDVNGVTGTLYSDSDESMTVFTDMIVKPGQFRTAAEGHMPLSSEATMGFYVNENGHPVIAHQAYGTQNTIWTEITDVTLSPTEWHRVTVQLDYRPQDLTAKHLYFSVIVNGSLVINAAARGDQTGEYASGAWFPMISKNSFDGMYFKGASASVDDVILDGEVNLPSVQVLATSTYEPADGVTTNADFTVRLSETTTVPVTVTYATADVTAIAGLDYVATSGQVVIPAGSLEATVSVTVNGDAIDDSDETFLLRITGVEKAVLGSAMEATGMIIDDSGDSDYDGLTNGQEIAIGTDPYTADTDGDGFSDYIENLDGSDPLDGSSLPTNPVNLAPVVHGANAGDAITGEDVATGVLEHTQRIGGSTVTMKAYNGAAPRVIGSNGNAYGVAGTKYRTPEFIELTFDRDTYFTAVGFGSWNGTEGCRISGTAVARLNGVDNTAENTFTLDTTARTLDIFGAPNPVSIVDNVTGRGLFVKAGESLQITFLNSTAGLSVLQFHAAVLLQENAPLGTVIATNLAYDPNANDQLSYAITAGNDSSLFAIDSNGEITLTGALDHGTASSHTLTLEVADLAGLTTPATVTVDVFEEDSDNDNLNDLWEFRNFGTLARDGSGDFDEDGVSDGDEHTAGTNPSSSDTDGDGYDDYVEVLEGSDPLDVGSVATNTSNVAPYFAGHEEGKSFGLSITPELHEHVEVYNGTEITIRAFNENGDATVLKTNVNGKFGADALKFKADDYISITFDRDIYFTEIGFGSWLGNEGCQISGDAVAEWNGINDTADNTFVHDPVAKTLVINGAPNPVDLIDNVTGEGVLVPAGSELQITFLNGTASLGWLNFHARSAVSELAQAGDQVINVDARDLNVNDIVTTEIIAGNDAGLFAIDANGLITVAGALDYEAATSHTLTVRATDLGGLTTEQDFEIEVIDENDALIAADASGSVAENDSAGTAVATVAVSGPNAGNPLTFSFTAGNDAGLFAIDANGQVTTIGALDFEVANQHVLTAQVTDGFFSSTATVTVNVTNVNEAPALSDTTFTFVDFVSVGYLAGTLAGTDPDAGDSLSYTIIAGNGAGDFSLGLNSGELTTADALDADVISQYVFTVEVSDGQLASSATITINLETAEPTSDDDSDGLQYQYETNTGNYINAQNTGTDPDVADSDGDGFDDGVEVSLGYDPTDASQFPAGGILFEENFDTTTVGSLPDSLNSSTSGAGTGWSTVTNNPASAPNAVFSSGPSAVASSYLVADTVPVINDPNAELRFDQYCRIENRYDGGVLEISINGGAWQDWIAAGGSFTQNGYDLTVSSSHQNPIGGREAWSGEFNSYRTTIAIFPAAALGQPVQLRWHFASDNSVASEGWTIDNIVIESSLQANPLANLSIQSTDVYAAEFDVADTAEFVITSDKVLSEDLTINYTVGGQASNGSDYATLSGSVVLPSGSLTVALTLTAITDAEVEGSETVVLTLSTSSDYFITVNSASVIIEDLPFDGFKDGYFGDATENVGDTEDYDGDGISNLVEYAFDLDPTTSSSSPMVMDVSEGTGDAGADELRFTFEEDTSLPDVNYIVETSEDLVTWGQSGITVQRGAIVDDKQQVQATTSMSGARRFMRVRIERVTP